MHIAFASRSCNVLYLEQAGSPFDLVTTPLGHSIEFGAVALQDSLEFDVGEMTLKITTHHWYYKTYHKIGGVQSLPPNCSDPHRPAADSW